MLRPKRRDAIRWPREKISKLRCPARERINNSKILNINSRQLQSRQPQRKRPRRFSQSRSSQRHNSANNSVEASNANIKSSSRSPNSNLLSRRGLRGEIVTRKWSPSANRSNANHKTEANNISSVVVNPSNAPHRERSEDHH